MILSNASDSVCLLVSSSVPVLFKLSKQIMHYINIWISFAKNKMEVNVDESAVNMCLIVVIGTLYRYK